MRNSSLDLCPVPLEQQPVHEYEQLKDSGLFRWVTLEPFAYGRKLLWVWVWGWLMVGPIAAASFPPYKFPLLFSLSGALGAVMLVVLVVVRLYLGWWYICDRLQSETVFYEESGWYDGQTWIKPPEMLKRDRLIVSYQIKPILKRLQRTSLILASLIVGGCLLWLGLTQLS
jgi:hypothetical protein